MRTASKSSPAAAASTPAGDDAVTMSSPAPLSRSRSASSTSGWSSATRILGARAGTGFSLLWHPEGDHGIDLRGPARRQPAREGGDGDQEREGRDEGERIGGADAEEHSRHEPAERQRTDDAGGAADGGE